MWPLHSQSYCNISMENGSNVIIRIESRFMQKMCLGPRFHTPTKLQKQMHSILKQPWHVPHLYIYIYIYRPIYVWKLNQTVLELDFWAVKSLFFPRWDLNSALDHSTTSAPWSFNNRSVTLLRKEYLEINIRHVSKRV